MISSLWNVAKWFLAVYVLVHVAAFLFYLADAWLLLA